MARPLPPFRCFAHGGRPLQAISTLFATIPTRRCASPSSPSLPPFGLVKRVKKMKKTVKWHTLPAPDHPPKAKSRRKPWGPLPVSRSYASSLRGTLSLPVLSSSTRPSAPPAYERYPRPASVLSSAALRRASRKRSSHSATSAMSIWERPLAFARMLPNHVSKRLSSKRGTRRWKRRSGIGTAQGLVAIVPRFIVSGAF